MRGGVAALTVLSLIPQTWTPHYFVLTSNKIYYSEETCHYQTAADEEDDDVKEVEESGGEGGGIGEPQAQFLRFFLRSATTTSSTARSAGSTGSWAEVATVARWLRSSCRSTARAEPKTAPSWCGRARPLSETTPSPSGKRQAP